MVCKLVLFDLENTLVRCGGLVGSNSEGPSSLWTLIPRILGLAAELEEEQTKESWRRGEYPTARAWSEASVRIHKKYGLTRQRFMSLIEASEILPGYDALLRCLKQSDIATGIISGGFLAHARHVQKALDIDRAIAACEYHWGPDGCLESWTLYDSDYEHKVVQAKRLMDEFDASPEDCAFVGDGANDVALAQYVGTSFAVNADSRLADVATHVILGADAGYQLRQHFTMP